MVNIPMFLSEIPNNSKAREFAATKRRSTSVTTIASKEVVSKFRKSLSLACDASRSLRGLLATLRTSFVSSRYAP